MLILFWILLTAFVTSANAESESILYRTIQVATEADCAFTTAQGGAIVTTNIIRSIISDVSALTEPQLGIRLALVHQRAASSSSDPYQSTIAAEMTSELETRLLNTYANGASYDVAFLLSGKDVGTTGGATAVFYQLFRPTSATTCEGEPFADNIRLSTFKFPRASTNRPPSVSMAPHGKQLSYPPRPTAA